MKKITAFLFVLLFPVLAYCQADSLTFVQQQWQTQKLSKGVIWKSTAFASLFNSQQIINIVEIDLKKYQKKLGMKALPNSRERTSTLAQEAQALAAINGGFFDMKNGGAVDFIKVNNQIINPTLSKSARANAYFAFDNKRTKIVRDSATIAVYPNVMLAGPMLIEHSNILSLSKNAFNDNRHPRTAIGIKDNKLIFITVDGRRSQSQGVSLHELTDIMRWYGCQHAMNLDGGGSTAMYILGQPFQGIVNYPSDNQKFDHEGERKVSNIIYIKK